MGVVNLLFITLLVLVGVVVYYFVSYEERNRLVLLKWRCDWRLESDGGKKFFKPRSISLAAIPTKKDPLGHPAEAGDKWNTFIYKAAHNS